MNKKHRILASVTAIGAALSLSTAVLAQEQSPGPAPGAQAGQWGPSAQQRDAWRQSHRQHLATALHDILNIKPGQETAFQSFLAAMHPAGGGMMERPDGQGQNDAAGLTTPERLDRIADRMAKRQARFQQRAEAIKTFYAALDSQQQRSFDAVSGMMMHDHMMGHHDHGFGGPGHMGNGPHGWG